jgi:hypothetical protein
MFLPFIRLSNSSFVLILQEPSWFLDGPKIFLTIFLSKTKSLF